MNAAEDEWLLSSHSIQCGCPMSLWRAGLTNLCSQWHMLSSQGVICALHPLAQTAAGLGAQKAAGAKILPQADGFTQEAAFSGPAELRSCQVPAELEIKASLFLFLLLSPHLTTAHKHL